MITFCIKDGEIIARNHLRMFLILCCLATAHMSCAEEPVPLRIAESSSPESTFAAYVRLIKERNWDSVVALLSSGERDRQIVLLSAFGPGMDKHNKVTSIVEKYFDEEKYFKRTKSVNLEKLSQEKKAELFLSCVTDKKRLFVEVNLRLDQVGADRETPGSLRNVIRQGRKAQGSATYTSFDVRKEGGPAGKKVDHRDNREIEVPVYFIQQESKWVLATNQEWERAK